MKERQTIQAVKPQSVDYLVQIGGTTKTVREWLADPNIPCKREGLYRFRVNKCKLSPVEALMATKRPTRKHGLHTYNGVTQSIPKWAESKYCVVSKETFKARFYHLGWSLEASLLTPANRSGRKRKAA